MLKKLKPYSMLFIMLCLQTESALKINLSVINLGS